MPADNFIWLITPNSKLYTFVATVRWTEAHPHTPSKQVIESGKRPLTNLPTSQQSSKGNFSCGSEIHDADVRPLWFHSFVIVSIAAWISASTVSTAYNLSPTCRPPHAQCFLEASQQVSTRNQKSRTEYGTLIFDVERLSHMAHKNSDSCEWHEVITVSMRGSTQDCSRWTDTSGCCWVHKASNPAGSSTVAVCSLQATSYSPVLRFSLKSSWPWWNSPFSL